MLQKVLLVWVLAWTVIAFALMGIDKAKAKRHKQRIPEKMLFLRHPGRQRGEPGGHVPVPAQNEALVLPHRDARDPPRPGGPAAAVELSTLRLSRRTHPNRAYAHPE